MSFPCSDCEHTFENAAARQRHRWSQHSKIPLISVGGKEYAVEREGGTMRCPIDQCGHSYKSRQAFVKHVKTAHGIRDESPTPSPALTGSSQRSIWSQGLSFASSGESKTTEHSGDRGGEALPPAASSIVSKGGPWVPLDLPESPPAKVGGNRLAEESPPATPGAAGGDPGFLRPEGLIRRSEVGERSIEGEESVGNKGKLLERVFAWLGLLSRLFGMGTQKPACVPEKALDTRELAAQVSDVVADAVIRKLATIGLTAENIKKLENLGEMTPIDAGGVSEVGNLADAILRNLPAIGPVEKNIKLATGGGTPSLAAGEGSHAAMTPVHSDHNSDASEIPSSSFNEDPFVPSTWATESNRQGALSSLQMSGDQLRHLPERGPLVGEMQQFGTTSGPPKKLHPFETIPQFYYSRQRKRAVPQEAIPLVKKRARHNEVDCEKDEFLVEIDKMVEKSR
ncbi:hypothetical protein OG21DRAFT_1484238 [Imleria badia]|nr:hypothetical protein OG21DRAFT_1484238 [Imleria badia]